MSKVYLTQCGRFTAHHGHDGTLAEAVHSHTFHYEITFYGPTNAEGYLIDFRQLADTFKKSPVWKAAIWERFSPSPPQRLCACGCITV